MRCPHLTRPHYSPVEEEFKYDHQYQYLLLREESHTGSDIIWNERPMIVCEFAYCFKSWLQSRTISLTWDAAAFFIWWRHLNPSCCKVAVITVYWFDNLRFTWENMFTWDNIVKPGRSPCRTALSCRNQIKFFWWLEDTMSHNLKNLFSILGSIGRKLHDIPC